MNKERISILAQKYLSGTASELEMKELHQWYDNWYDDEEIVEVNTESENENAIRHKIFNQLQEQIALQKHGKGRTVSLKKRKWYRIAAAAVLILIATGTYLLLNKPGNEQPIASNRQPATNDIAPGGNKAILALADGSQIVLDTTGNGAVTKQGGVTIIKLDGQLAYNIGNNNSDEVLYNTITTPKGGQYQLILTDGTKVWLNAASSIKFPVVFAGTERRVEMNGEAYFEVAPLSPKKGQRMPFKVNVAGKGEVEVLGTHFNINSYADEATINTTLLEGKVKMTSALNSQLLAPGQQAQLNANGQISIDKNANVEEVIAWKNGKFIFENADIKSIMRQVEKWYDVEIVFNGNITTEEFVGIISRNVKISQIITMLEKTGAVKFKIEGRKIIVK